MRIKRRFHRLSNLILSLRLALIAQYSETAIGVGSKNVDVKCLNVLQQTTNRSTTLQFFNRREQ